MKLLAVPLLCVLICLQSELCRSTVDAQQPAETRSSCGTLVQSCTDCITAGCTWTEPLYSQPVQAVSCAVDTNSCVDSCSQVGTTSSCFAANNYVERSPAEVCAIKDRTVSPATTTPIIIYSEIEGLEREDTAAPTESLSSLEITSEIVKVPPKEEENNNGTTVQDGEKIFFLGQQEGHNNTNGTTDTNATLASPEISCAGFIACEKCPDNGLACAYVAWSCSAFCPKFNHIPCYEIEGDYSEMTAEEVCEASIVIGLEEEGLLPDISVDVSRSITAESSGAVQPHGRGRYSMGVITGLVLLFASCISASR